MQYSHAQASSRMHFAERVVPRFERRHRFAVAMVIASMDAVLLWAAFWSAYELRYGFEIGGGIFPWDLQSFSAFYGRAGLFVLFCLVSFLIRGVYRLSPWTTLLDEGMLVAGSITVAMGGLILTNYLSQFSPSRLVFVYAWALAIIYLMFLRVVRRTVRNALWARSIGVERLLIVGSGEAGRRIVQAVVTAPDAGLRIAGFASQPGAQFQMLIRGRQGMATPPRLGNFEDVPALLERHRIDQVVIAIESDNHDDVASISSLCHSAGVRFFVVPDLLQLSFERAELSELAGVPLLGVRQAAITGWNASLKRGFDVVVSGLLLVMVALPMAVAWAICRKQGVPYRQKIELVGRNGELFDRLQGKELSSHPWLNRIISGAPVLTNVLRGEMSLVGPLAATRRDLDRYEQWHHQRLRVTPGVTGLWAVQGRTDLSFDEMVRLDLFYAENWSLWLDVKILLRSVPRLRSSHHGR
ncbi:MAG: sugar transferase [Thermomicrobiales bacterium]